MVKRYGLGRIERKEPEANGTGCLPWMAMQSFLALARYFVEKLSEKPEGQTFFLENIRSS